MGRGPRESSIASRESYTATRLPRRRSAWCSVPRTVRLPSASRRVSDAASLARTHRSSSYCTQGRGGCTRLRASRSAAQVSGSVPRERPARPHRRPRRHAADHPREPLSPGSGSVCRASATRARTPSGMPCRHQTPQGGPGVRPTDRAPCRRGRRARLCLLVREESSIPRSAECRREGMSPPSPIARARSRRYGESPIGSSARSTAILVSRIGRFGVRLAQTTTARAPINREPGDRRLAPHVIAAAERRDQLAILSVADDALMTMGWGDLS